MSSAPDLRAKEQLYAWLAWTSFGLGAIAVLFVSLQALLAERPPPPENFLAQLGVILIASLAPTFVFRVLAMRCRRRRADQGRSTPSIVGSLSLFDDSTLRR